MRFLKILIALSLTVLTGCGAAAEVSVQDELHLQTLAAEEPIEEKVYYTVEMVPWEDVARSEDGTELAAYRFLLPMLSAQRTDGSTITEARSPVEEHALTVVKAFREKFDKWAAAEEFSELTAWAEEDFIQLQAEGLDWRGPYTLELTCDVYETERLLSIAGSYYSNTGGAHPNIWQLSWNFDLEEGIFFDHEFLADDTDLQDAVSGEILRQAETPCSDGTIPAETYWEDYAAIIANWGSYAVTYDENGMLVIFSPYELAPYAMGAQSFRIPYAFLAPYLNTHGARLLGVEMD